MLSRCCASQLSVLMSTCLGLFGFVHSAIAQPWSLPYESQPPFIPVLDLFGDHGRGLVLGAEEVITGLPAPVSIGNATFVPGVDLDDYSSEAFTKFRGDVLIRRGDLFIGRMAVGQTLENQATEINDLGVAASQSLQRLDLQGQQLQGHATAINQLGAATTQIRQTQDLQGQQLQGHASAITQLGATTEQLGISLQAHSEVLNRHEAELQRVDQNVQSLGSGVAGSTALAAALTRIPTDLTGAPLACGVGTGGYSSRYAMALGCTVKLTPSLALSGGGGYLFGGGTNYGSGSLSNVAGALGLVYRFGMKASSAGQQGLVMSLREEIEVLKGFNSDLSGELSNLRRRLISLESLSQLTREK